MLQGRTLGFTYWVFKKNIVYHVLSTIFDSCYGLIITNAPSPRRWIIYCIFHLIHISLFGRLLLTSHGKTLPCNSASDQECYINSWHTDAAIKLADLLLALFPNVFSWKKNICISASHHSNQSWPGSPIHMYNRIYSITKFAFIMSVHSFLIKHFKTWVPWHDYREANRLHTNFTISVPADVLVLNPLMAP